MFQVNFFDEFQLEGVSADANEIFLEVAPENLSRALKTAQNAKSVKIKLTKKNCPCLTLAAELVRGKQTSTPAENTVEQTLFILCVCVCVHVCQPSLSSVSRVVTHDIPVDVIPRRLWHDFREPQMPDFDVSRVSAVII